MRSPYEQRNQNDPEDLRELGLLTEISTNPKVTQRQLSDRLGVALGLTNIMVRNLTQRGYVKVIESTWKRRLYTLTPQGFSYRVKLMVTYFRRVLDNYKKVRQSLRDRLEPLALNSESRVAIIGTREFAELVFLGLKELGIEEMDFFDPNSPEDRKFLGMPIYDLENLLPDQYEYVVIALISEWEKPLEILQSIGVSENAIVSFFSDVEAKS